MDNLGPTVPPIVKEKSAIFTAQKVALVFDWLILFSNTFFTNIWFPKIILTLYHIYRHLNCLWYFLKHHHQSCTAKWCCLFTCKNGDSWYRREFKILNNFQRSFSVLGRKSDSISSKLSKEVYGTIFPHTICV